MRWYVVIYGIGRESSHERTLPGLMRNKGLEPSYRYLGEHEIDWVGGGAGAGCSHLTLAPLECLFLVIACKPECEGKSCVRMYTYCYRTLIETDHSFYTETCMICYEIVVIRHELLEK